MRQSDEFTAGNHRTNGNAQNAVHIEVLTTKKEVGYFGAGKQSGKMEIPAIF
jgi:hypothetical protein